MCFVLFVSKLNLSCHLIVFDLEKWSILFFSLCFHTKIFPRRDGTSIVLSDDVGQIYFLNTGQGESQKDAKYDQVVKYRHADPLIFVYHDSI